GLAIVIESVGGNGFGEPRPYVVTEDRWAGRLAVTDFTSPVEPLARVRVPKHFNPRSPQERRDLASQLRNVDIDRGDRRARGRNRAAAADDAELDELRAQLRR